MAVLEGLTPERVFYWFEQLSAIPHGSGNTDTISRWLDAQAETMGLEHYLDDHGNVTIIKPAAPGYEKAPAILLQGHSDMVCVKDPGVEKNMDTEGLDLAVEGDVVYAKGTTLGGDDGIAIAMAMAILEDNTLVHPRLEAVFTTDEETGMDGAAALDVSKLQARTLLNLDSEAEGIFTCGCAGGAVVTSVFPAERENFWGTCLRVRLEGLEGGHSGMEIHKKRGNAIVLLAEILTELRWESSGLRIVSIVGGSKNNAIPSEAEAIILVPDKHVDRLKETIKSEVERRQRRFRNTDPNLRGTVEDCIVPMKPMKDETGFKLLFFLTQVPNGVQAFCADLPKLPETSLNLGILTCDEKEIKVVFCLRSAVNAEKDKLAQELKLLTEQTGGRAELSGIYSAWEYRKDSPLRDIMTEVYRRRYGKEPVIDVIHAGVECGLFGEKLPGLDAVSIGPDLEEIHTPREKMHIASVQRTWEFILEVLRELAETNA